MSKTYKLTTLRDIFEQVPADRIEACMAEVTRGLLQAKAIEGAMRAVAVALGNPDDGKPYLRWPDVSEWTDNDGDPTISIGITEGGKLLATIVTGPAAKDSRP